MQKRAALLLLMMLLGLPDAVAAGVEPRLTFTPPLWKFGMITRGEAIALTVTVENGEAVPLAVTFVPTCTCLTVNPTTRTIPSHGRATFDLRYDSSDDVGLTTRGFIVRTDLPGASSPYYLMRGTVRDEHPAPTGQTQADTPGGLTLTYFYSPGCRSCEEFLSVEVPLTAKRLGVPLSVERKDVLDPANFETLSSLAAARGDTVRAIPALSVGDTLLQGDAEIRARFSAAVAAAAPRAAAPNAPAAAWTRGAAPSTTSAPATAPGSGAPSAPPPTATASTVTAHLAVLPVVLAGLIDGINPCAFTTLIFLLASLALAGRSRREVLIIGGLFSLSVFLSYGLIGLGFFAALRAASSVAIVGLVLRWVLFAVLVVFAGLSVYDWTLIRRGRPSEILLQLPTSLKRRIHDSIRGGVRAAALAGSSLVLGFLVSIFEFACTGQVYLPTLAYLARGRGSDDALLLLGLYNLCFILPLLVVFAASYAGVSSKRITTIFQARMGAVKLALAAVFAVLAVLTLVG